MENVKNELGNIYGSRISKNGKWLNLIIKATIEGKETFITCPVKLGSEEKSEVKAYAVLCSSLDEGMHAFINNIKVYQDKKPEEPKKEGKPVLDDECPFWY